MTSKDRVLKAIRHEEPDRVPLNIWLYRQDYSDLVAAKYGSVDAFYDEYGIDMFTVFVPSYWDFGIERRAYTIDELLDLKLPDPCRDSMYEGVWAAVEKYGNQKQRAVFCQIGAVFEGSNGIFGGMQDHLICMATEPEKLYHWYRKLAEWFAQQAQKVIDCGVDVVHLSDDWGQNNKMIFSPRVWWDLVLPNDKIIVDVGKRAGSPVSLHSCGYFTDVVGGCVEMGLDVINPIQPSAGMDPYQIKRDYGDLLCLYGTLDVREVLPNWRGEKLEAEVKSLMDGLKQGGGYIFCSAHTVNPDVPLKSVEDAYRWAMQYGSY